MQRASSAVADQVQSSQFKFDGGNGEIVGAVACFETPKGYEKRCGVRVTIQPLDKDWNPTDADPVSEFLSAGSADRYHPGQSDGPDDDPEDLGDDDAAEGNNLLSDGGKSNKQSKFGIFSASLENAGFKGSLLNGYLPNLVGTKAHFTQTPQPKGANYTGKSDPTALTVTKIAVFPYEEKAGAGAGKGKAASAPSAPSAASSSKGKGGKNSAADMDETAAEIAVQFLAEVQQKAAGQTLTRQNIQSRAVTGLVKLSGGNADLKKAAAALLKNQEWLDEQATGLGWEVVADDFTPPEAE